MNTMHVYCVTADDSVIHHVTAASEGQAVAVAKEFSSDDGGDVSWDAGQLRDDRIFKMTLVDSPCDPEDPDVVEWLGAPGYDVNLNGDYPVISAPCWQWAAASAEPQYLTCSEW